eukprot:151556_1
MALKALDNAIAILQECNLQPFPFNWESVSFLEYMKLCCGYIRCNIVVVATVPHEIHELIIEYLMFHDSEITTKIKAIILHANLSNYCFHQKKEKYNRKMFQSRYNGLTMRNPKLSFDNITQKQTIKTLFSNCHHYKPFFVYAKNIILAHFGIENIKLNIDNVFSGFCIWNTIHGIQHFSPISVPANGMILTDFCRFQYRVFRTIEGLLETKVDMSKPNFILFLQALLLCAHIMILEPLFDADNNIENFNICGVIQRRSVADVGVELFTNKNAKYHLDILQLKQHIKILDAIFEDKILDDMKQTIWEGISDELDIELDTEWKMSEKMIISTVTEKINGKNVVIPIQKIDISNVKSISIPRYDEKKLILKPVTYILNTE